VVAPLFTILNVTVVDELKFCNAAISTREILDWAFPAEVVVEPHVKELPILVKFVYTVRPLT